MDSRFKTRSRITLIFSAISITIFTLFAPSIASASLKTQGDWPDANKLISIDAKNVPRAVALQRVADAAGWSIVSASAAPIDGGADLIDVHIANQPASLVLETVLGDGDFTADRHGTLIAIKHETAIATPPAATVALAPVVVTPPAPSAATTKSLHDLPRGEDRHITGGSLRIGKDEVVHNVSVIGGNVDIDGIVTGELTIMGGSARLHPGAHVYGRATVLGGSLRIDDDARVDGNVETFGGSVKKGDKAIVGGSVVQLNDTSDDDDDDGRAVTSSKADHPWTMGRFARGIGDATTSAALLFVFGAMLLALGTKRMDTIRAEIAARPMRSIARGLVGLIASIVLLVVLCVTIVGIPVAVVGVIVLAFALYAGIAAVLTTAGAALLGHRTKNPYAHLAIGCALFFAIGALPFVGTLVKFLVVFAGLGAVFATRGAGLVPVRTKVSGDGPYRTAD